MQSKDLVSIGKIVGTFGNQGELKIKVLSDTPELIETVPTVYIELETGIIPIEIENIRYHKGNIILKIKSCNSITDGLQFKGGFISILKKDRPPAGEGMYYFDELLGLTVETTAGRVLGRITDIYSLPANDVYVVTEGKKEYLIPAISEVVREVDIESKKMIIFPMKGLLDDEN